MLKKGDIVRYIGKENFSNLLFREVTIIASNKMVVTKVIPTKIDGNPDAASVYVEGVRMLFCSWELENVK